MRYSTKIEDFVVECSDIQVNRETALATTSLYKIYLDKESGYPQIKIIAQNAETYEKMDDCLERLAELSDIPGVQNYFAIHDNYSNYPSHNDFTYTIPLTTANFLVLNHLFSKKNGFELILICYHELITNLPESFFRDKEKSSSYKAYEMIINYSEWSQDDHLYSKYIETKATHIEQLREWQAILCSDPISSVFIKDNSEIILNDILVNTGLVNPEYVKDYWLRYELEAANKQECKRKILASETLFASRNDIILCGIFATTDDIFRPYELPAIQCQNEIYKRQTQHESFTAKLKADPNLRGLNLSIPTQSQIIQNLQCNMRWNIDGSINSSDFDYSHKAWKSQVYYYPIDSLTRELLMDIKFERLANPSLTNFLVCLPYNYYQLIMFAVNIQSCSDLDEKEIWLNRCIELIEKLLELGCIKTIPEAIILEISKIPSKIEAYVSRYRAINENYYQSIIYPNIRQKMLSTIQMKIEEWDKNSSEEKEQTREFCISASAWSEATQEIVTFILYREDNQELLEEIKKLSDPYELTLDFIQKHSSREIENPIPRANFMF